MNKFAEDSQNAITLKILDELEREPDVTQRALSHRLGIALGLVNKYIKRLGRKGFIKVTTIPSNRVKYMLTPKGFSEKVRLTYEYMNYSISYFKDIRVRIDNIYGQMVAAGVRDVLIWGDGEVAELCYLSLRGLPLNLVGVVDERAQKGAFYGHDVFAYEDVAGLSYDAVLVASLNGGELERVKEYQVDRRKVHTL